MSSSGSKSGGSRRRRGLIAQLWSAIKWPFQKIERVEKSLIKWGQRRRSKFRHQYRDSKVIAPLVETLVWLLLLPIRIVWKAISWPFRLLGGTASKAGSIRRHRQWVHLLQGLPAIIAAVGAFAVLMKLTQQREVLPREYLQQAQRAYNDEHYIQARVYLQRVLQLGAQTDDAGYLLARTLEHTGQSRRAMAILDSLAPEDHRGDPRAHYRKAAFLFQRFSELVEDGNPQTNPTDDELRVLNRHLTFAEGGTFSRGQSADLDYFRGLVHIRMGDPQQGLKYLEQASAVRKDVNYILAVLYKSDGQPGKARQKLDLAIPYYWERKQENPQDRQSRLRLVSMLMENRSYDESIGVLQEGMQVDPDAKYEPILASVLIHRYESLPPDTDPALRMSLLEQALAVDPQCHRAFNHLLSLGGRQEQAAKDLLERLIAVGASAPLAHFALGIQAWHEHDPDNALWHLERAYKLDPGFARIGNNYAWFLAHDEQHPDPQRALGVINSVIDSVPQTHPDLLGFIETRGQIYVLLEQWDKALDDLERALKEHHRVAPLHESLALVYEKLGQPSLASKHANAAANLQRMQQASPSDD